MNAKQRYDLKHPVKSFRLENQNLDNAIKEYMKRNNINTFQEFMNLFVNEFIKRNMEYTYKLKD